MTRPMMYSLGATVLWGFWGVTAKMAGDRLGHWNSTMVYSMASLGTILFLSMINRASLRDASIPGVALACLAGILGGLAIASFQKAITAGPLGPAISLTSLYPIIPVIYGIMILGEKITMARGIGMGLAIAAGVLLCF
jgi:drug/metabolite transporter (DMT)-like permease